MIDSTNPRVMADNIRQLFGESGSLASAIEALQTFSTDEHDTGLIWIDGRHIYLKVFIYESAKTLTASSWNDSGETFGTSARTYTVLFGGAYGNIGETLPVVFRPASSDEDLNIGIYNNRATNLGMKCFYLFYLKPLPAGLLAPNPDDMRTLEEPEREEVEPEPIEEKK